MSGLKNIFPEKDAQTRDLHRPTWGLLKGYFMLWNLYNSWEVKHQANMVTLMRKQQMPHLQPNFWLLMNSVSGLPDPHGSQSFTTHTECVVQQVIVLMQVGFCSSTAYRNISSSSTPHINWESDFSFCLQPNLSHSHVLIWSLLSAKQAVPML